MRLAQLLRTMSCNTYKIRIKNADQLVTVACNKEKFKRGVEMNNVSIICNGGMIVGHDGLIVALGPEEEIAKQYADMTFDTELDATGKSVLPGLVDGHTHPVFAGDRCHEFKMKLAGATYMDVHKAGGGIGFTVKHVREASEDELLAGLLPRLDRMLKCGTTVVEAKSGYGLNLASETKMLKVLHRANQQHPITIVSNYCGAHSVPPGSTAAAATEDIINNQIPAIMELKKQGQISPDFFDIFCEKNVFEMDDTRKILKAGHEAGLLSNFHGDELNPLGAAELAAEMGCTAISHLEWVSDKGISEMAAKDVIGVLLPTTAYVLRIPPAPARKLIDGNVPIALGTDFNPNAHCLSVPFLMNISCVTMRMTMNEALVASTLNAAASLNCSDKYGSLELGKHGDFIVVGTTPWEHIIYELCDPPIEAVFKSGDCVFKV